MKKRWSELLSGSGQTVEYIMGEIARICRDMGQRAPGSEGERRAAEDMADCLRDECGCTGVTVERFQAHPDAFLFYFRLTAAMSIACAASYFLHPWLSALIGVLTLMVFLFQFVLDREAIDPFFPKKESVNVTAVRPCSAEVRQRVFLNGHVDAAHEFTLNYHFGGVVFETPGLLATIGVVFYIVLSCLTLCGAGEWTHTAGLCGLIFVPFFLLVAFTCDPKRVVDGANDNLTGCYMGIALLREMERRGIRTEHTEIGVILTGSEEAGLRGAKAWCRAHRDDYRDVPTYIVTYDTIHDPKHLMVNARDLNGTVTADEELCRMFLNAARTVGVPCRKGGVPLFGGATDSAAFTQGGFHAVGITGLNHVLEDYYHTRRDSYDNLNAEGLENCYRATVALLDEIDRDPDETSNYEQ